MKKKILIFSLAYFPKHVGGAEVAIKEITDRLGDTYEFHMVTNRYDSTLPKVEQVGNVLVHRIGFTKREPSMADLSTLPLHINKVWYQFRATWKAKTLHKKYHYDATWAMMAHSCAVPAGAFKKEHPEVKYVLTLQEGDPPEYIEKKMLPFGRRFKEGFKRADTLQTISTFLMRWGKGMGFEGPSSVIPNAVNTAHFMQEFSETELEAARKVLGKKDGYVFVVTTSRLVKKNAVDVVIRAIERLPKNVHFVVYGTGPDEVMLKELASECGATKRVHFMGHLDHADMPLYLKACDIFIRPSRSEGMGNSFVEAMAAGLPVIGTQEGGIADFLFDEKKNPEKASTGWVVEKDNYEDIVVAVEDILKNPEKVSTITKTAQQMAVERFDWDLIAERMKNEIFEPVLNS